MSVDTKKCRNKSCQKVKPASGFHRKATNPDGLAHWCKECNNSARSARKKSDGTSAKWRAKNPHYSTAKKIGLDVATVRSLRIGTDCCEICGTADSTLHLDHDHATGVVRGFLCRACNLGLGNFADSPERLMAAARYLKR